MFKDRNSFLGLSDDRTASDLQATASDLRAAIEKVRNRKQSHTSKMALLIVTGILFFIVVGLKAGLGEMALLVGVILFHEAGHALGMRIFGYKNISLFFIPFLGALITARKENVTAWQEALVSLMGPLPGLFLGIVLLPVFAGNENESLRNFPLLLLFLNGFNMLPFMPLDGGHFCNQVLFRRNRYLEATFSVFGILGLLVLAFFLRWLVIGIFALLMLALVVQSIKLRSIAHEISLQHGDNATIENDVMLLKINDEVRNRFQTRSLEQRAGLVYETLKIVHQRPPKARATALLLLLYLVPLPLTGVSVLFVSGEKSIDTLIKEAEQGDAEAQCDLGKIYAHGQGVPQDYSEAVKWTRKAAEQGYAEAQYNMGVAYGYGQGVPQDYSEAEKWTRKAAEQGYAGAQYNLGLMYADGMGVTQDYDEALKWYRKAAVQGHIDAQHNLGFMYARGEGVKQDYTEAAKWYQKAAEQGDSEAQNNLGVMYDNGQGVPQDNVTAYMWYDIAATNGYKLASIVRDFRAKKMSSADIEEAKKRAKICLESNYEQCD